MTLSKSAKNSMDKFNAKDAQRAILVKYHETLIEKGERLNFHKYRNKVEELLGKKIPDAFKAVYSKIDLDKEYCIHHSLLYDCGVFTGEIKSGQIKRKLDREKFIEDVDYITMCQVASSGNTIIDIYLTKATFNKMLMRSKNHPEYADYFTFLEMCITSHENFIHQFDFAMEKKESMMKDDKIDNLEKLIKKLDEEAKLRHANLQEEITNMSSIIEDNNELLEEANEKLELSLHGRVPSKETPKSKQGQLMIVKLFHTENEEYYNYAVIRGQTEYCGIKLKSIKKGTPTAKLIYKLNYTPNSCDLWLRVKKELKQQNKINCRGASSNFDLTNGFTKDNLINLIRAKNREKYDLNK
jgi:hypothetical protein